MLEVQKRNENGTKLVQGAAYEVTVLRLTVSVNPASKTTQPSTQLRAKMLGSLSNETKEQDTWQVLAVLISQVPAKGLYLKDDKEAQKSSFSI